MLTFPAQVQDQQPLCLLLTGWVLGLLHLDMASLCLQAAELTHTSTGEWDMGFEEKDTHRSYPASDFQVAFLIAVLLPFVLWVMGLNDLLTKTLDFLPWDVSLGFHLIHSSTEEMVVD